jgi:hypothetical protein
MKKRPPDAAGVLDGPADFDIMETLRRASPVLLVVGIWLAFHPYAGIVHDSRLYVAQAMRALHPEIFNKDFFFAFGSQDDYTLLSKVFAPLVGILGPTLATMVAVGLSHALWLSGATALALRLAPDRGSAIAGLAIVAGMPAFYGGWDLISYGEGFFTSRLPAEAIALWALWALTSQRLLLAAILAFATTLFHPLVGLTVLSVGFVFLVMQDVRWIALGIAGIACIAILTFAGIAPFDALLRTMDPEWLSVVQKRNVFVFPALWPAKDFAQIALLAMTAGTVAILVEGGRRHLMIAAIVAALASIVVAYLGADMFRNVFLIQMQIWRTTWLLTILAYLGAGILIVRLWRLEPDGFALIALIVLSWLVTEFMNIALGIATGGVAYISVVARLKNIARPIPVLVRAPGVTLVCLFVIFLVACRTKLFVDVIGVVPGHIGFWDAFVRLTEIEGAAVVVLVLLFTRCLPEFARKTLPVMALMLVIAAAAVWDRRREVTIALTAEQPPAAFDTALPPDAQVFWEDDVRGTWFLLRRPSYFSAAQGAGLLFQRQTAATFLHRARVLQPLIGRDLVEWSHEANPELPEYTPHPALDRGMLVRACQQDSNLDAMVLTRAVDGAYAARWSLPDASYKPLLLVKGFEVPPRQHYYLYRCADLR